MSSFERAENQKKIYIILMALTFKNDCFFLIADLGLGEIVENHKNQFRFG